MMNWGAKLLLGLLILSFGIWGIGDYISPSATNLAVATIGKQEITSQELNTEVQQRIQRMRSLFGNDFTFEQAKALGVVNSVLDQLVQRRVFAEGADDMGLMVDDAQISKEIKADPRFQSAAGHFDRNTFNQTIYNAGLNESSYARLFRGDLIRSQLLSSIHFGRKAPRALAEKIYRYRNEKRVAEFIRINHKAIRSIPSADDVMLKKYHKDNAQQFTAPEYREIELVQLRIKDIVDEIDVPEQRIIEEYENRINEFKTLETRSIQQILAPDENKAKAIYQKALQGADFYQIGKEEMKLDKATMDLGTLTRDLLPLPELADAAFKLSLNTVSEPVKSALGWHIIRVSKINPATQKLLADVRADLKKGIAQELAVDVLYNLSNKFEDELGSGADITEAAKRLNFTVRKIQHLSRTGQDYAEKKVAGVTASIIKSAFDTPEGEDSALGEDGENGYFVLHVNKVIKPTLRPFDTVLAKVATVWKNEQQAKSAEKNVKKLMEGLNGTAKITEIAKELGISVKTTEPFLRNGTGLKEQLPGNLISQLFKSNVGKAVSAAGKDAHFIAILKEITAANPITDKPGFDQLSDQLNGGLAEDLTVQLGNAIREKVGVTINRTAVNTLN